MSDEIVGGYRAKIFCSYGQMGGKWGHSEFPDERGVNSLNEGLSMKILNVPISSDIGPVLTFEHLRSEDVVVAEVVAAEVRSPPY